MKSKRRRLWRSRKQLAKESRFGDRIFGQSVSVVSVDEMPTLPPPQMKPKKLTCSAAALGLFVPKPFMMEDF